MTFHDLSPSRLAINRQRAEFADAVVEDRFNRHYLPQHTSQLKVSLLFCAAFYVAFAATDVATLGPTVTAFALLFARIAVAVLAVAGVAAVTRRPESVRVAVVTASVVETVGMAVFMVLCWYQPSATAWNALSLALMVMALYINIPNRFIYAFRIACGASIAFCVMVFVQDQLKADDLVALVLLLILGNTLGHIGARRYHLARREEFRAAIQFQQLADRDPLTGCFNRRVLQKGLLEAELTRTRRFGTALSVVLCDIDHFKRTNDSHGHAAGDQVLADFAGLLLSMTRETVDSVVRYGGEEFLLVLPETDLEGARTLAERIRHTLSCSGIPVESGAIVHSTASFGIAAIAALQPATLSAASLIDVADAQLYAAKRAGRDCVRGTAVFGDAQHSFG